MSKRLKRLAALALAILIALGIIALDASYGGIRLGLVAEAMYTDTNAINNSYVTTGAVSPLHEQGSLANNSNTAGKAPHLISVINDNGGTITPGTNLLLSYGSSITFCIEADDGYEIADVIVDGDSLGAVSSYTFNNVTTDHYISARFQSISTNKPESIHVVRYSGADRVTTALEISKSGWDASDAVVLACSNNFADALAGATLAAQFNAPILLCNNNKLDPSIISEIQRLGAKRVIILGGTAAISKNIENALNELFSVERIFGNTRNGTAAAIAEKLCSKSDVAFLVSNENYADALSVSSVAAIKNAPILYANPDGSIPVETAATLKNLGCDNVYIVGGTQAISSSAEYNLGIPSQRVFGADRYLTSIEVVNKFDVFSSDDIAVATGKNYPDALAGAAFAVKNNMPVLLIDEEMPASAIDYFNKLCFDSFTVFGGRDSISDSTVISLLRKLD